MAARECDEAMLRAELADSSTPLIIDIHAEWCGYCKRMAPDLDRIAAERAGSLRIAKLDADPYFEFAQELGFGSPPIRTLPLVILFKDGVEVARRGSGNYDELTAWLAEHGL